MKSIYDAVLLDLDGTIAESAPGIIASVKMTLEKIQWDMPADFDYTQFIGPPIFHSLMKFCHMPADLAEKCIPIYRGFYNAGEIFNNSLFPGMVELMRDLKAAGAKVCVATSKPQPMADRVIDHFALTPLLDYVAGADTSDKKSNKDELIERALQFCRVPVDRAVMVGDTHYDAGGAQQTGTHFIGVLYGYGKQEEMEERGARCFVRSVEELRSLLLTEA